MKTLKNTIYFLLIILLFTECNKDGSSGSGSLAVKMTYTNADSKKSTSGKSVLKSYSSTQDEYYTKFGDYITSITPSVYIIKFMDMQFTNWISETEASAYGVGIIDNNLDWSDPARLADFTNNNTVSVTPNTEKYNANIDVPLNIFFFQIMFMYQEFELPEQYVNVPQLNNLYETQFDTNYLTDSNCDIGGMRDGLNIRGAQKPFVKDRLFDDGMPESFVFGGTDSTYVWKHTDSGQSINDPMGTGGYIVRSNKYNEMTIPAILEGETLTLHTTMSFDFNNLIQVYAGADNIPYTSDDIFVYAPNYWERLSVNMSLE